MGLCTTLCHSMVLLSPFWARHKGKMGRWRNFFAPPSRSGPGEPSTEQLGGADVAIAVAVDGGDAVDQGA